MTDNQIKELAEKISGSLEEYIGDETLERFEKINGRKMTEKEMIEAIRTSFFHGKVIRD